MRKIKILLLCVAILVLNGCSLAQPARQNQGENSDTFVGFYVVFGERLDRTNWVEYGSDTTTVETEFGGFEFDLPNEVLFAEYNEETTKWIFPGTEGYCAFVTEKNDLSTGSDGLQNAHITYGNQVCTALEGSVFIEKSDKDFYVTAYEVYETVDGRIYINGHGNSMSAPASSSGALSTRHESTYCENGEVEETYEFEVSVTFEPVVPTTSLVLVQYDENDVAQSREEIALHEQHIKLNSETAWMLVIEQGKDGALHRSAYEPPISDDDRVAHNFYIPQADGSIQIATLLFDEATS